MEETKRNAPIEVIKDGSIKASIWKNPKADGSFLSVTFARTYQGDDGKPTDSQSFSGRDLLVVSEVASQAYRWMSNYRAAKLDQV